MLEEHPHLLPHLQSPWGFHRHLLVFAISPYSHFPDPWLCFRNYNNSSLTTVVRVLFSNCVICSCFCREYLMQFCVASFFPTRVLQYAGVFLHAHDGFFRLQSGTRII